MRGQTVFDRLCESGVSIRPLKWRPAEHPASFPWGHRGAKVARGIGGHWRLYRVRRGQWACYHGNAGGGVAWEYPEFNKQAAQARAEQEHIKMALAALCLEEEVEAFV